MAPLNRIEIATKLRTLYIGGYEELQLRGFDIDNNTFSTLEGMRFQWEVTPSNIIEFVPLKSSAIKSTELRKKLEKPGF